jgi:hypothetical protein
MKVSCQGDLAIVILKERLRVYVRLVVAELAWVSD